MKLIQKGVGVKMAYLAMSKYNYTISTVRRKWKRHFATLKRIMLKVNQDLIHAWATQYKVDVNEYGDKHAV